MMITAPVGSGGGGITNLTFTKGFAGAVEDKIKQLNDYENGVVARKKESLNSKMRNIDSEVERVQRRVDNYRDRLVKQFSVMENTMRMLQSQQSAMLAQLGSF
jgi:flagellar capping protein FliD